MPSSAEGTDQLHSGYNTAIGQGISLYLLNCICLCPFVFPPKGDHREKANESNCTHVANWTASSTANPRERPPPFPIFAKGSYLVKGQKLRVVQKRKI